MASGRPRQPNDPGVVASAQAAVTSAARPGLAAGLWHWRYQAALIAGELLGTVAIGATLGLGWLTAAAGAALAVLAVALAWPPSPAARHREGLVRRHAAPGQDRAHPRLDPYQGHPARRLLGRPRPGGGERPAQPHRRARRPPPGRHAGGRRNQARNHRDRADPGSPSGTRGTGTSGRWDR
jgi:hypothetical protein